MKKHCFLTLFRERRRKSSKNADFAYFLRTLYKVSWKTWKNTVFSKVAEKAQKRWFFSFSANFVQSILKNVNEHSHFLHNVAQKKKTLFLRTLTKCPKRREKTLFSHTFCWTSRKKSPKNAVFSHFLLTMHKVFRKTWKYTVSSNFCETSSKKLKKRCFSHFLRTLFKVSRKTWKKTLFSHTFFGTSSKKLKKRCFFAFLANYAQSVSKNVKKHCFLTLFAERRAKSSKYAEFSHFLRTLYKVSWKTWKKTVLSYFLQNIAQKKRCSFTFFANFVQSVSQKTGKKQCFLTLFVDRRAKSSKNVLFSHFLRTLYKVSRKTWKNTVF